MPFFVSNRTGLGGLEDVGSSDEGSEDSDSEASPSTSGASCSSDVSKPVVPPSGTRGSERTEPQDQPSSTSSSSSQSPAPSSPTQVEEEEVQKEAEKECTAETSQNASTEEDKSQVTPTEAPSVPAETSQAQEEVRCPASDVDFHVGNVFLIILTCLSFPSGGGTVGSAFCEWAGAAGGFGSGAAEERADGTRDEVWRNTAGTGCASVLRQRTESRSD